MLDYLIEEDQHDWKTFRVTAYICYFVSKTDSNFWLPAITIGIVYGGAFLVLYSAAKHFDVGKFTLFVASMMFLATYWYYDQYSGTRNGLAFSIATTSAYFHLLERRYIPLCYFGYFLAALTHSGGIMPVGIALLAAFTFNTSGKFINGALIFGMAGGGVLLPYLAEVTDIEFFDKVGQRALDHSSRRVDDITSLGTNYIVNISFIALSFVILFYISYYFVNSEHAPELKRFYKFASLCLFFATGSAITSGLIFMRFVRFILPVIVPVLFMVGMTIQREQLATEGDVRLSYYSNPSASFRYRISTLIWIVVIAYTAIHLWYLCAGSSIYGMTFEYLEY